MTTSIVKGRRIVKTSQKQACEVAPKQTEKIIKNEKTRKITKKETNGQKYPTPEPSNPLYIFYTTLLKQKPDSQMALKWCKEHGIITNTVEKLAKDLKNIKL